ncbi:MAG TPA: decaprenyl-phosphate phosphoribosyltransferase [Gemmatimonadaceae bacterium]|jgi:decaprenyl-phosphate phosphoribosyltransferase|nr:decaprenyl-phosphate phosphoribosyltransferase [Gemmatimonadaceae bacterium]
MADAVGDRAGQVARPAVFPLVRLLRPRQWIKNGFVLAPLMFSGEFVKPAAVGQAFIAFALFCVASSATYVFNDLKDRQADAQHPVKSRKRPLASGEVKPGTAKVLLGVLYAIVLASFAWSPPTAAVAVGYIGLNLAYSLKLKHIPVIDIFCLAAGFVLRVYGGAVAIDVPLSTWMMVTTLSLALYLAAIKRRDELATTGDASRSVLQFYTLRLLDRYAETAALSAIMFYGLFVVTVRPKLNVTIPFVLFGLFRYWYIVETGGRGESPTDAVWADPPLIITVLLWAAVVVWRLKQGAA